MTPIDANLSNQIEQDITGSLEQVLEDSTKKALENLQKKGSLSQEELTDLYEANFKNMVSGSIDDGSVLAEKIKNLTSVENKLLATYMTQAKENNEEPWAMRKFLYWACSIDNDITENSPAKNIAKGVIDELLSIPNMVIEIFKSPREFAKGLYTALVKNFSQTMKAIKDSYTDIGRGIDTPESAYKTGRSGALILLTLFPGAIGKRLIGIGKFGGQITKAVATGAKKTGEVAGKGLKYIFPESAKSVSKNAPKVVDKAKNVIQGKNEALKKAKAGVGAELAKLKKGIDQSKVGRAGAKGVEIGKKGVAKLKQGINWMDNLALVNDILRLPIRLAKGVTVLLGKIIPKGMQPRIIKDMAEIVKYKKKMPNNPGWAWKQGLDNRINTLKTTLVETGIVWGPVFVSEVNDITNQLTNDAFLAQLAEHLQEDNDQYIKIEDTVAVGLETASTDISSDALDYPQLEGFDRDSVDWNSENRPVIIVIGLASKSGSQEINDRISRERAQKAQAILAEKYGIPEQAFQMKNQIQSDDDTADLADRQGVRVSIDNLQIENPTYVADYDGVREKYNPTTDAVDLRLENIDPIFLAESENIVKEYISSKLNMDIDDIDEDKREILWEQFQDDVAAKKDDGLYLEWLADMKEQSRIVINTGVDYSSTRDQQDRWAVLQQWVKGKYLT